MFAKARSQSGMVSVGTNALERNVSGNITISEMPCTPCALRPMVPNQAKIHAMDQPAKTASTMAASTPKNPPRGGSPSRSRWRRSTRRRSGSAACRRASAGQRRDPRDRQRLEPVEHALVHVLTDLDTGRDTCGQHGLADVRPMMMIGRSSERPRRSRREDPANIAVNSSGSDRDVEELLEVGCIFFIARRPGSSSR